MAETKVAARGEWGTVEWARDKSGRTPARDIFDGLPRQDQAKLLILFKYVASDGRIDNREKFRQLGEKAGPRARGLWEFKSFQIRLLGDFRPGRRFLIAAGTAEKKSNKLNPSVIATAVRVLEEHDERERQSNAS